MSLIVGRGSALESEVGGDVPQPSYLPCYRFKRNSQSCDESSSYDGDRPLSRETIIGSQSDIQELDEELRIVELDSPDAGDEQYSAVGYQHNGRILHHHTCEECFKTFSSPGKLKQHEYSHTGETPFECKIPGCDKKFTSNFKLKRHVLIHSQTKTFACDICNRAFRRKDHLKNHEKVHDPGKAVYLCSYQSCGRTYNSLASYKKHQAMHSAEEGQLDCKICKAILVSQEDMMNHLKDHASSRSTKGAVDKKFACNQCDKKFFTRKDLKRHSVVHTGNREFSCPYCTQRFGRKDHMTRHAKKTHAQFYEQAGSSIRHRLPSTPGQELIRTATRKERSISDPGPVVGHLSTLLQNGSPEVTAGSFVPPHQVLEDGSPSGVVKAELNNLAANEGATLPVLSTQSSVVGSSLALPDSFGYAKIKPSFSEVKVKCQELALVKGTDIHPEAQNSSLIVVTTIDHPQLKKEFEDKFHSGETTIGKLDDMSSLLTNANLCNSKNEFHRKDEELIQIEDQNLQTIDMNTLKQLLEEKKKIDISAYFKELGTDLEKKHLQSVDAFEKILFNEDEIKNEPISRPITPHASFPTTGKARGGDIDYDTVQSLNETVSPISCVPLTTKTDAINIVFSCPDNASPSCGDSVRSFPSQPSLYLPRTQSVDSLTRTKNPVLPSVHAENPLVVPEPKQVRYANPDPLFALDFEEDSTNQLTELKGSLFTSEEFNQSCFQPWN